jgi:uncharacterized LabA/DUF88 family protein
MAFEIFARVLADATGFDAAMRQVQSSASKAGDHISSELGNKLAGLFTVGAVEEGLRRVIEYADDIKNLSVRTGIDVEELQKLDYAATLGNASLESITKAVERFGIAQAKARAEGEGGKTFEAFQRMGISKEQIENTEDFVNNFYQAGEHIKGAAVDGQLLADMTLVMGKNARELIPAFKDGLSDAAKEAEKIGAVIPEAQILRMAEASDNLKKIWFEIRSLFADLFLMFDKLGGLITTTLAGVVNGVMENWKVGMETKNPIKGIAAFGSGFMDVWRSQADMRDREEKERSDKMQRAKAGALQAQPEDKETEKAQEKAGKKMEEMQHKISAAEAADAMKALSIRDKIAETKRKSDMDGLTDQEKEKRLRQEIADMQEHLRQGKLYESVTDLEAASEEEKIAQRQAELTKLTTKKPTQDNYLVDSLAKIGGYGSSASSKMESLAERTAIAAEEIAKNTQVELASESYELG